jgi:putative ABC transport system permease protein
VLKDLRYAVRMLRQSPGFTLVALASLAIGIGANTAIFSLVNEVLLRPMPVADPAGLVSVFQTDERNPGNIPVSHLNFKDLRRQNGVLADMAAVSFGQANFRPESGEGTPQPIQLVTGNYFDLLGVRLAAGRGFLASEDAGDGSGPVAVISWPFWQRQFGGRPEAVGAKIQLNRSPFTIVGVTPRSFTGTFVFGAPSIWVPMSMHGVVQPELTWYEQRRGLFLFPFGRLKPGATVDQARENLQAVMAGLAQAFPVDNAGRSAAVVPLIEARVDPNGRGQVQALARLLLGVVGIVLLLACVNLANLLLGRASRRRRELAVRLAIGADRRRLVRQLLTESLLLSCTGGALGLMLANWLIRLLSATDGVLPFPVDDAGLALDPRVLVFTLGVSLLTGVLFGLVPALQASRTDVIGVIKLETVPGGEGRGWLRKSLVAAQVALSAVSLVTAGLFLRSLDQTARIAPGFSTENVAALTVNLGREGYSPERGATFYRQLAERARALPGAEAATIAQNLPLAGVQFQRSVFLDEQDSAGRDRRLVPVNYVGPDYFRTTQIPLVRGREFDDRDTPTSPQVAIVSETMARQFWPNEEALGKRFRFFGEDIPTEVVGIARDAKVGTLAEDPVPLVYEPIFQDYSGFASLLVRVNGPADRLGSTLRGLVADLDRGMSVANVTTLASQVRASMTGQQTLTAVVGIFGAVALFLAAIGLYGVASHWVGQRTREIGVRMALGARPSGMLLLVLRQSMTVVLVGLGLGLGASAAVALLLGPQLADLLVQVHPTDAASFAGTASVLLLVALTACAVPARRAARIDPLTALRQD